MLVELPIAAESALAEGRGSLTFISLSIMYFLIRAMTFSRLEEAFRIIGSVESELLIMVPILCLDSKNPASSTNLIAF